MSIIIKKDKTNFLVEKEDINKNMLIRYHISYDTDYEYLFNFIKNNGNIEVSISDDFDKISIETNERTLYYEDYMFDGDFDESDCVDFNLGKNVYDFYCYYFNYNI